MERNPERAEELLFDNVASYLEKHVAAGERNKVKGVIDFFYELALKGKSMSLMNPVPWMLRFQGKISGRRIPMDPHFNPNN